jgi:outer membrane receptor for ferrienterochelin and colicin
MKARLLALILAGLLYSAVGRADDLADEADLQFTLGAEAYQKGDFRGALEHFLASNRLVPNRNVLYNIARTYEQVKQYPEAFRYYTQALDGEKDAAARAKIEAALVQLGRSVAVLRVTSDPPGATLYVDRKDLGARGEAPRTFGLAPGSYKLIVELSGYEPVEMAVDDLKVGQERNVVLKLEPILGVAIVEGAAGSTLHVENPSSPPRCSLPCRLELAPGRYAFFVARPGHKTSEIPVTVQARSETKVRVALEPLTGTLVVNTDEPRALIEVDGKPQGFTPAILTLPAGRHRLRISMSGFRSLERSIEVLPNTERRYEFALTQAEEVVAASRVGESVDDAPSSVTVIPKQELRALAYPTLAEAVRGTAGVYVWDDRSYVTVGMRGLGRLGSYGNRLLVLYDGHPVNDDWIGSSYVGYDALTDLGDVERIEVVRGPGSVLYGTNAFSGVINVVSDDRERPQGGSVGVGTNQNGVARARARGDVHFGRDAGLWTSVAAARSSGKDFEYPELGEQAQGVDGFTAGTVRGRAYWRWLTAQWSLHSHSKQIPTGAFETLIGDPRNRQIDTRAFVELRAEPQVSSSVQVLSRAHVNLYRFRGTYARDLADEGLEVDHYRGAWAGFEQRVLVTPMKRLRLTVGGEGQVHFEVKQTARTEVGVADGSGAFLDDSSPFQVAAGYALADLALSDRVRASVGTRVDAYSTFGTSINPRASVIVRPYADGNLKILGGKAFRAPSVYELYYNDGGFTQVASPELQPEVIYSGEIEHTHRFSPTVSGTLTTYANYVKGLILTRGSGDETDPLRYENSTAPLATLGGEAGLRRDWRQGWMLSATYGFTHALFLATNSLGDAVSLKKHPERREVANAPTHLATLKGAVPIVSRQLLAATRLAVEGPRYDRFENVGEPLQRQTPTVVLWDIVLTGNERRWGLEYSFGVYNAFDWQYEFPVSGEFSQRTIAQDGRTFLASAELAF